MSDDNVVFLGGRRGRPPRAGVRASVRVELLITDHEAADLRQIAKDVGQPVASIVREAVNEFVSDFREKRVFGTRPGSKS